MSGYRHRHRLRHMANPHCWFRRPSDDPERLQDLSGYQMRDLPAMGIPMAQVARREDDREREREEEEEYHMALVRFLSASKALISASQAQWVFHI